MADDDKKPAKAASPAKGTAGAKGETIIVRGPEGGRRRGGLFFGPVEATLDLAEITAEQLAAIVADPFLSVKRS